MGRKTEFINLRRACIGFPEDELESIDEIAKKQGTNRSDFVRSVVSKILPKRNKEKKNPDSQEDIPDTTIPDTTGEGDNETIELIPEEEENEDWD